MTTRSVSAVLILSVCMFACPPHSLFAGEAEEMNPSALRVQGYTAQKAGDFDKAIQHYRQAIQLAPDYPLPYNDLGILYEQMGLLKEAEAHYLEALEADPGYYKAHSNLALLYESQGRLEEALEHWEKRAEFGQQVDDWTNKAMERVEVWEKQAQGGMLQETEKRSNQKLLTKNQVRAEAYYKEALRLDQEERYAEALDHLAEALDNDPWNGKTIETMRAVRARMDEALTRGVHKGHKGPTTPLEQLFLTTSDLSRKYNIIGVVTAINESGNLDDLNQTLRQRALTQGADGLILVHYLSHKDQLHGYGTAVKLR